MFCKKWSMAHFPASFLKKHTEDHPHCVDWKLNRMNDNQQVVTIKQKAACLSQHQDLNTAHLQTFIQCNDWQSLQGRWTGQCALHLRHCCANAQLCREPLRIHTSRLEDWVERSNIGATLQHVQKDKWFLGWLWGNLIAGRAPVGSGIATHRKPMFDATPCYSRSSVQAASNPENLLRTLTLTDTWKGDNWTIDKWQLKIGNWQRHMPRSSHSKKSHHNFKQDSAETQSEKTKWFGALSQRSRAWRPWPKSECCCVISLLQRSNHICYGHWALCEHLFAFQKLSDPKRSFQFWI